jgi:hypothetical protein
MNNKKHTHTYLHIASPKGGQIVANVPRLLIESFSDLRYAQVIVRFLTPQPAHFIFQLSYVYSVIVSRRVDHDGVGVFLLQAPRVHRRAAALVQTVPQDLTDAAVGVALHVLRQIHEVLLHVTEGVRMSLSG